MHQESTLHLFLTFYHFASLLFRDRDSHRLQEVVLTYLDMFSSFLLLFIVLEKDIFVINVL